MFIILVWRPESCNPTGIYTYDPTNRFDGIEVFSVSAVSDSHAMALVNEAKSNNPDWHFSIEEVK